MLDHRTDTVPQGGDKAVLRLVQKPGGFFLIYLPSFSSFPTTTLRIPFFLSFPPYKLLDYFAHNNSR